MSLFNSSLEREIDAALGGLNKAVVKLERVSEKARDEAIRAEYEIAELKTKVGEMAAAQERAERVREKLAELVL